MPVTLYVETSDGNVVDTGSQNPLTWMIEVNGVPMDDRFVRREIQEIAFENGLIPYIPGDCQEKS